MLMTARTVNGIAGLRRFVRGQAAEHCELCGMPIPDRHGHILEPAARRVLCACLICAEAVTTRPDGHYRQVPSQVTTLTGFRMTDAEWHSLGLPIDMAFLFHSTPEGRPVALYPGPLGAAESLLSLDAWAVLEANNPVLKDLQPDVEALLVDRTRGKRACYRVPIDRCYALVGVIRTRWQGWSGGDEVWRAIDDFLDGLAA